MNSPAFFQHPSGSRKRSRSSSPASAAAAKKLREGQAVEADDMMELDFPERSHEEPRSMRLEVRPPAPPEEQQPQQLPQEKRRFKMGYMKGCEKCAARTPGHWAHFY